MQHRRGHLDPPIGFMGVLTALDDRVALLPEESDVVRDGIMQDWRCFFDDEKTRPASDPAETLEGVVVYAVPNMLVPSSRCRHVA